MAKFRPAGSRKPKKASDTKGLIPCLFLLLMGFGLVFYLLYSVMSSGK